MEKTKFLFETAKEKLAEKINAKDNLLKSSGVKDPWAMMNLLQNMQIELRQAQTDGSRYRFDLERRAAQYANLQAAKKNLEKLAAQDVPLKDVLEFDLGLRKDLDHVERLDKYIEKLVNAGYPSDEITLRQAKADYDVNKRRLDDRILQVKAEIMQKVKAKQEADIDTSMATLQTEIVPLEKFIAETREPGRRAGQGPGSHRPFLETLRRA